MRDVCKLPFDTVFQNQKILWIADLYCRFEVSPELEIYKREAGDRGSHGNRKCHDMTPSPQWCSRTPSYMWRGAILHPNNVIQYFSLHNFVWRNFSAWLYSASLSQRTYKPHLCRLLKEVRGQNNYVCNAAPYSNFVVLQRYWCNSVRIRICPMHTINDVNVVS